MKATSFPPPSLTDSEALKCPFSDEGEAPGKVAVAAPEAEQPSETGLQEGQIVSIPATIPAGHRGGCCCYFAVHSFRAHWHIQKTAPGAFGSREAPEAAGTADVLALLPVLPAA